MIQLKLSEIQLAITSLYEGSDVQLPSASRCVVQLGELISGCNLNHVEKDNLTARSAIDVLLQRGGLLKPPDGLGDDALAGFIYASPRFGCLFVERGDIVVRRRFSAAHELGHYLLHFRPLMTAIGNDSEIFLMEAMDQNSAAMDDGEDEPDPDIIPNSRITCSDAVNSASLLPPLEQMEREANRFAVELLMPPQIVRDLNEKYAAEYCGKDLIWRIATDMLLSRAAIQWRMFELGLIAQKPESVN